MKVMILAAGEGRRMLPLTRDTPKPLLQAGDRTLIEHLIGKLTQNGFEDFVINHAHLGDQIVRLLGDGSPLGINIRYSAESKRLETAGGILQALPLLGADPFLVVNSDIWTDYSFKKLRGLAEGDHLGHLVMVDNPEHNPAGDFMLEAEGSLSLKGEGRTLTFSGISVYHPDFFSGCESGVRPLKPLLDKAIASGRLGGEYYAGTWMDIGTPERLQALDRQLKAILK